jgi:hypothetical protein
MFKGLDNRGNLLRPSVLRRVYPFDWRRVAKVEGDIQRGQTEEILPGNSIFEQPTIKLIFVWV